MGPEQAAGDESARGKHKVELAITWAIVGIPLLYGIFNAVKAAVQLFAG